jgi:hypothetical protein
LKLIQSAAVAAAFSMLAGSAFAQVNTSSVTTDGSATLVQPVKLTQTGSLAFGRLVRPETGTGTATISTAGALTVSGGVVALAGQTVSHPVYTVAGEGGQAVTTTVPETFDLVNGTTTIPVTLSTTTLPTALDGTLGGAGAATFSIGGSFPVANDAPTGAYTGQFNVTVAYN